MTNDRHWELIDQRVVLQTPWATVENNCYRLPGGGTIDNYLVVKRPAFVLVVAEQDDNVVLIEQYRPATNTTYVSLPAGYLHESETPTAAAARELAEETGYRGSAFQALGTLDPLPGFVVSPAHVIRCVVSGPHDSPSDPEGEVSRVLLVSWPEILKRISCGGINEMQAVAALLLTYGDKASFRLRD